MVALLMAPYRWWPIILIWLTAVDTLATYVMFDVFTLPDDSLKVGLAAYIVRRMSSGGDTYRLDSLSRYAALLVTCTACFSLVALVSAPSYELWTGFWMGDVLGVTMICPIFFLEREPNRSALKVESVLTTTMFLVAARILFGPGEISSFSAFDYPYLILPLLLWASIRLPDRVVAGSTILVAGLAVFYTGQGHGPFLALPVSSNDQVLVLQAFLLVITTSPVLLSLGLFERKTVTGESLKYSKELQRSEETYRLLFETSAVAIAVVQNRSVSQMNRSVLRMFKLETEEDLLTLAPSHQPNGQTSEEMATELYRKSRNETVSRVWSASATDGTEFDLEITMFGLPESEDTVLTGIDVTKPIRLLKMLEEERNSLAARVESRANELLHANTSLSRSVRAKQEFVAHLSHELKTPLTALIAQSDTLLEELFGPLTGEQESALIELRDSGERLSRLIIDLLELHRLEAGTVKPAPVELELQVLLDRALEGCRITQGRRRLKLQREDLPVVLETDPELAKRVFFLLLSRAARQSKMDGSFGLRVEQWPELKRLDVTIWDTGPELPSETFQSMSDPYSVRSEGTERAETGLTLALSAQLLESMGGELSGRSGPDGSLITASFPWRTHE